MPLNAGLVIRRGNASDLVARVEQAERRANATSWTTVGGPTADPETADAAAWAATDRIGLESAVAPTYQRHPSTRAARAIANIDLVPGRLRSGVGPNHKPVIEGVYGPPKDKPLTHLREYVTNL
jgi:alkanesulfonate monooxygenase SsuD/methylene tetrahydromethanopterin reductase-like flavin-dependent oxidoreductase (luciferase family)